MVSALLVSANKIFKADEQQADEETGNHANRPTQFLLISSVELV